MDAAVLALGDLAADRRGIVNLAAIGAEIVPAAVGILGDDAIGRADEARFVALMVPRNREFEDIDGIAFNDILENRTVIDVARRQWLQILHAGVVALHDIDFAVVLERQAERE